MPDFRKMTVQSLRELARKVLGPGHTRLKTKTELVSALEEAGAAERPAAKPPAASRKTVGERAGETAGKAARAAKAVVRKASKKETSTGVRAAKAAAVGAATGAAVGARAASRSRSTGKAGKVAKAAATLAGAAVGAAAGMAACVRATTARAAAGRERRPVGADPEGYFVARVRGEDAVRDAPHPLGEGAIDEGTPEETLEERAAVPDEGLGELPWGYGDDAFVALPRDPRTIFLYWDWSKQTMDASFGGLDHPRAQLWMFARAGGGWERVRSIDFALESRGFYVHDLEPGRVYRAEIHVLDRHGRERLLAHPSNEVALPPVGPSPIVDDRFIRIPWDLPLGRLLGPGHAGGAFSEEARAMLARLSDWSRFAGKTVWGGSAGGMGGRPSSPTSSPSSPIGPVGRGEK